MRAPYYMAVVVAYCADGAIQLCQDDCGDEMGWGELGYDIADVHAEVVPLYERRCIGTYWG